MLENLISENPKVSRGERTVQLASITKIGHPNSALDRGFQFLQVLEVNQITIDIQRYLLHSTGFSKARFISIKRYY